MSHNESRWYAHDFLAAECHEDSAMLIAVRAHKICVGMKGMIMNRPNFTGVWKFNQNKSVLEISTPDSTTFIIEHREPYFHLERTHVSGKSSDTFIVDLTTDNKTVTKNHGGIEIRARMTWEGEILVFDSEVCLEGKRGTNKVSYQLADNGHTFIANEQFSSMDLNYKNKWVFDKQ